MRAIYVCHVLVLTSSCLVGCGSSSKSQADTAGAAGAGVTAGAGAAGTVDHAGSSNSGGAAGMAGSGTESGGAASGGANAGSAGALGGVAKCTPQCGASVCGSDGCDGVCGVCAVTELCQAGACVAASGADVIVGTGETLNAIQPEIYGLAFASKAELAELNVPLNRYGGNGSTRYNWQLDVHNTAADYYFENTPDKGEGTFGAPDYLSSADVFTRDSLASNAAVLTTIPTIGFTPSARKNDHPYDCGFPKTEYPAQSQYDQYDPNCGNGVDANMKNMQGAATDAMNTSQVVGPEFASARVQHIVSAFGASFGQHPHFYALDNEMMLWSSTHRDVHPMLVNYAEVWQKTLDYAPAIRAADPRAFIMGYGTWGAADVLEAGVSGESKTYGAPLVAWYLQQLAQYEKDHSARLVDCIDLHFYPQQDGSVESQV
ncbi:MAG TPA: glycoside hydrolase family 44 protein, partial [Polyangiaceae bacterium]|nr:glycoside hydrolase family 44 protein [Polyangiaceae bacterium]